MKYVNIIFKLVFIVLVVSGILDLVLWILTKYEVPSFVVSALAFSTLLYLYIIKKELIDNGKQKKPSS